MPIAVWDGGRIISSEAFGVTDQQSATAATPRSVMQIASLMKQVTAAAILRLAERGALTLDDRIEKFVPELNTRDDHIAAAPQPHVGTSPRVVPAHGALQPPFAGHARADHQGPQRPTVPLDTPPGTEELQQCRLHAAGLCDRIDHGEAVCRIRP